MDLSHLIFVILFYLGLGIFVALGFVKPSQVGRAYFIYHGVSLVLVSLAAYHWLGRPYLSDESQFWFLSFVSFALIFSLTAGWNRSWAWTSYAAGVTCSVITLVLDLKSSFLLSKLQIVPPQALISFVTNSLLSALLLGFTMAAMLLGHWYLVQPKLSIQELTRLTWIFIVLVVIRFAFGTYFISAAIRGKTEIEIYRYFLSMNPGVFLLMRWTWGLLGPLILCYLIWKTVRIRSTQSATGILYIAVICVLTGETLSQYLALFHSIPL
jgi:hypothetical protein